ncbi:MAG: ribonuclease H family protein [Paludibacter sp.]|nr:ribonuclease H family protein [Bacteroidales bacterium]MCM1069638.1 ribonuclease H family protein [Prevotella sp.]MCM1354284.1 ribonuclease H family protein [Bacteroides sp.]MCM1443123.1 ribonuclease H family protein [Muribaculum sp.]MCM1482358.1 ribonuclease H family protein [Paludibacter sp.]
MKKKIYVVWAGKQPGIYTSWEECERQVKNYAGARFKGFASMQEAEQAYVAAPEAYVGKAVKPMFNRQTHNVDRSAHQPQYPALAVDAACSGNPGVMEFRGVIVDTGTEVFRRGPFKHGTNNIGEFLAIVLGLAWLQQNNLPWLLYSDSRTALSWVQKKKANSKLERTAENAVLFDMLATAEQWLRQHSYTTEIRKWDTEQWGEIPADFGRK